MPTKDTRFSLVSFLINAWIIIVFGIFLTGIVWLQFNKIITSPLLNRLMLSFRG